MLNDEVILKSVGPLWLRIGFWLQIIGAPLLIVWALAGFFMEGEDDLGGPVPWLVVLGGGAGERLQLACQLFAQGHGRDGLVLTGDDVGSLLPNRAAYLKRCGIQESLVRQWPNTMNTFEEISSIGRFLKTMPNSHVIVISDALHMPRLRYLRTRLALEGEILFRQSRLDVQLTFKSLFRVIVFWFREPLAYVYYRLRY
jgi:uncharacterized SAM-binding protein YcdF (DUF218 family)